MYGVACVWVCLKYTERGDWWLFSVFYLVQMCTYMPVHLCNMTMLSLCCVFCLIKFSVVQSIYNRTILYVGRWCMRCVSLILNLFFVVADVLCFGYPAFMASGMKYEYKINNDDSIPHQNTEFVAFLGRLDAFIHFVFKQQTLVSNDIIIQLKFLSLVCPWEFWNSDTMTLHLAIGHATLGNLINFVPFKNCVVFLKFFSVNWNVGHLNRDMKTNRIINCNNSYCHPRNYKIRSMH